VARICRLFLIKHDIQRFRFSSSDLRPWVSSGRQVLFKTSAVLSDRFARKCTLRFEAVVESSARINEGGSMTRDLLARSPEVLHSRRIILLSTAMPPAFECYGRGIKRCELFFGGIGGALCSRWNNALSILVADKSFDLSTTLICKLRRRCTCATWLDYYLCIFGMYAGKKRNADYYFAFS